LAPEFPSLRSDAMWALSPWFQKPIEWAAENRLIRLAYEATRSRARVLTIAGEAQTAPIHVEVRVTI
jgi:hypothetical protein